MSSSTRLLILGTLLDEPMNGYQVRRRLEVMGADSWASVAFGSIYHGLSKMADEGLLTVVESGKGGKTVYAITEAGREDFHRNLLLAWHEVRPIVDPFQVALTYADRLDKAELIPALHHRIQDLRRSISMLEHAYGAKQRFGAPRHIDENLRLTAAMFAAQLAWAEDALRRVEAGELF
ncbi:PadR family transcriptional regulator [Nonomuraea indica]|uniref:PadR family transcriptional regulator n=1 Tax=Nonomuraea indica TaxID=1581193 RepID=A0ABW8AG72_9ACTN|nr:PadR family transcriptional regulator [Nonomuraea indica]